MKSKFVAAALRWATTAVALATDHPAFPATATYCNPLLIPNYPVGKLARDVNNRAPLDAGATAFFRKPVDHGGLINVIRRALGEITTPPTPGFDTTFTI